MIPMYIEKHTSDNVSLTFKFTQANKQSMVLRRVEFQRPK